MAETRDQGTQVNFLPHRNLKCEGTCCERSNLRRRRRQLIATRSEFSLIQDGAPMRMARSIRPRSLTQMSRAEISCSDSWASSVSSGWERSYQQSHQQLRTISKFDAVSSSVPYLNGTPPPSYQTSANFSLHPDCQLAISTQKPVNKEIADSPTWRQLHMCRAKLKATSTTSELLSGFAMIAMVELQVNDHSRAPQWLLVCFAVTTTILVSVHIFALMVSTYVLPHLDLATKLSNDSALTDCPHHKLRSYIDLAWVLSTFLGLILFLLEIAILCWVKFWDFSRKAAASATAIVLPVLVIFLAFAMYYHWSLVVTRCCIWSKHKRKASLNNPV